MRISDWSSDVCSSDLIGGLGTGKWEWPGWLSMLAAIALSAALAAILGLVIFRTKALYFALITSGISLVAYELSFAWSDLTGGAAGISTAGPLSEDRKSTRLNSSH